MKPADLSRTCDRCGAELPLGATKYRVVAEITSDWDGYLPESVARDALSDVLEKASRLDETTLENQVHMELNLLVCPACRREIVEILQGAQEGATPPKTKITARLQ